MKLSPSFCLFLCTIFPFAASGAESAPWWSATVEASLEKAEHNRAELVDALQNIPLAQRPGLSFLLENMPVRDLRSLSAVFLQEHIAAAYEARAHAPWKQNLPEEIFFNDVLPYSTINEPRELWIRALRKLSLEIIGDASTPGAAAMKLNQGLFGKVGVKYSTKRRRADQSPYESMETGLASCTGLSILLVDACRSVGVPARLVGIPNWIDNRGNHTWVEIWDGDWHFMGAAEPDPNGLDRGWFTHDASLAIKDSKEHSIWATSFKKTATPFPLVWARGLDYVSGINVTDRYTPKTARKETGNQQFRLMVKVMEYPGGPRVSTPVQVFNTEKKLLFEGSSKGENADRNDFVGWDVEKGAEYEIRAGAASTRITAGTNGSVIVPIFLAKTASAAMVAPSCTFPTRGLSIWSVLPTNSLKQELESFFAAKPEEQAHWKFSDAADRSLSEQEVEVRAAAWEAYRKSPAHEEMRKDYEAKTVRFEQHTSPFTIKTVGTMPTNGWPLFIAMHGGGNAAKQVNDSQWRIMQNYYKDQDVGGYLYVALRAPNDTWNGFYDVYVYPLIGNLIKEFLLFGDVDPNKVFIMGYSHGGYGAFAIGPKMPDHFAAIHSSAAAPTDGETSAKTLRSVRFTFMIGERDNAYGRLDRCQKFDRLISELRGSRTNIYPVTMEFQAGHGHTGLPDKNKIKDMYPHTRNPVPREISWELTDNVIRDLYWVRVSEPGKKQELNAVCDKNRLQITSTNIVQAEIMLDSRLVDFKQPITLDANGTVTTHQLKPSLLVLCQTLVERADPDLAFTARLPVPKSALR